MDELVLPYLCHVQAEFSDSFVDVGIILRFNLCWIRNFTNALHSENCNEDLMGEGSWHVLHVVVAEREDEQLVEQWVLDVVVNFRIHTAACEFNLHECPALGKPG